MYEPLPPRNPGQPQAPPKPPSFYLTVGSAFLYPLKGLGPFLLLGGTVLLTIASFLSFWGIFGLLVMVFVYGYLASYLMNIIADSGEGDDNPPGWPEFSDLWGDILHPFWLFFVPSVFCSIPLIALYAGSISDGVEFEAWRILVGVGIILFFLPMMLLSVSMHDSLEGLNPLILLPAYIKVFPAYLVALGILFLAVWVEGWLGDAIMEINVWVGLVLKNTLSLYFLMVDARVLGLLYRARRERLGWDV